MNPPKKLEDLDVLNKTGIVRVDLDAVLDDEVDPKKIFGSWLLSRQLIICFKKELLL